jgi:hypothetical protein
MNGITDANQNFDTYWQRVKMAFDERKIVDSYFNKTVMVHSEKAMATHWGIMQAACSRWHVDGAVLMVLENLIAFVDEVK